ncbi:MAG TPA: hypothetical protein VNZ62_19570 [Capillimicrobium sp.]|nr:hypothetical protein [Capillimicrobium sp.]
MRDRLAGVAVAGLAALALVDATGAAPMEPGALPVAAFGVAGLVIVARTRPR